MRMPALILTIIAATLLIVPASPQDKANLTHKNQIEESAKKVKELQKEQIATLKEMAAASSNLFKIGRVSYEAVIEARLLLLKAELDAADKESRRITLYQNFVDMMKEGKALAKQRVDSGRGTQLAVLNFKARRLEAEIHLERAKAKEAKKKAK